MNREDFYQNSIPTSQIEYKNVYGDGSCLYRCMIRYLVDHQKKLNQNPYFFQIFDRKNIHEGDAARNIQKIIKNWIIEHQDETLDEFMNLEGTIKDLLLMDHEDIKSVEEYGDLYSIFAGDPDYFSDDSEEEDEEGNKQKVRMVYELPVRWGGLTELYAFYKMMDVSIFQWVCKRWNKKKDVIEEYDIEKKGGRIQCIQVIGDIEKRMDELSFHLLFVHSTHQHFRHYLYISKLEK